jgi:hypothetical protein
MIPSTSKIPWTPLFSPISNESKLNTTLKSEKEIKNSNPSPLPRKITIK